MRKPVPQTKGYSEAGASMVRRALRAFFPDSGSPNEDITRNLDTLRKRSRLLYMSSPAATSGINTNRTKIVGVGLTLKTAINREVLGITADQAKAWQRRTEAEWRLWSERPRNCDAIGLSSFSDLQQLVVKSWLLSGDCFALIKYEDPSPLNPYGMRIHIIEADRVSTPNAYLGSVFGTNVGRIPEGEPGAGHRIYDGVEIDDAGSVVAYHIADGYPHDPSVISDIKWTRVLAFGEKTGMPNVLHIMDAERPDQYRGVPYLSQIIEPLLQTRRYTDAELMAALVQSFFTAWIQTETDPMEIPINEVGAGDLASGDGIPNSSSADNISDDENEYEMGPGTVLHLQPGETVQFGNPNIPTAGFDTFLKAMLRTMGAALEMPYDVLVKEYNSSYSSARAAIQDAWEGFRMRRAWMVADFCKPAYERWLAEAVALGRIKAPGFFDDSLLREAWCGARWIGPAQGVLDPLKEARANLLLISHGIKTHAQVTTEMTGGDWEENVEQLRRENELLAAAAIDPETAMLTNLGGADGDDE